MFLVDFSVLGVKIDGCLCALIEQSSPEVDAAELKKKSPTQTKSDGKTEFLMPGLKFNFRVTKTENLSQNFTVGATDFV